MKKRSKLVKERNAELLSRIRKIKADHPSWGYRRVWAHLKYVDGVKVNKKRVYRVMSENALTVKPDRKLIVKRRSNRSKWCKGKGLNFMSDNGSQPTSVSFMKACSKLEVKQVFTSYSNPKGNADTERMIRTMKE